jgi:phage shock protein PspC (stress-responsive transcriptional regulator)
LKSFWKKIQSRKFLAALAGLVTGLAMVFGLDESTISAVAGAVVSASSVIAYIVTEGKVDAAAVEVTSAALDEKDKALSEAHEVIKALNEMNEAVREYSEN